MKKPILSLVGVSFLVAGLSAFAAEKVIITGEPVMLEKQGEVYMVPSTYTPAGNYYYATVEGTKRVCYLEKQPNLGSLDLVSIKVNVGGESKTWNCYMYDTTYFTVSP